MTLKKTLLLLSLVFASSSLQAEQSAHQFFDSLSGLCGSQYIGEMTFPTDGQDSFKGKTLVADLTECNEQEIRVPFIVGEDQSRTWVFTKTDSGLRLKHDHRHKDGSPDEITNYGGDANGRGSRLSQSFPADAFTQQLIPEASTNVWTVSFSEDLSTLTYHLERHAMPRFTAVLRKAQ